MGGLFWPNGAGAALAAIHVTNNQKPFEHSIRILHVSLSPYLRLDDDRADGLLSKAKVFLSYPNLFVD